MGLVYIRRLFQGGLLMLGQDQPSFIHSFIHLIILFIIVFILSVWKLIFTLRDGHRSNVIVNKNADKNIWTYERQRKSKHK